MADLASMNAALTGINTAVNISSGLVQLVKGTKAQDEVIKLNTQILAAQTSALAANADQFALLQRVRQLETDIAHMKNWEAEKARYELHRFATGSFAYALKPSMSAGEPAHMLCANCYQQEKKRILQRQNHLYVFCLDCKAVVQDNSSSPTFG